VGALSRVPSPSSSPTATPTSVDVSLSNQLLLRRREWRIKC
jgi:hypothetical protein